MQKGRDAARNAVLSLAPRLLGLAFHTAPAQTYPHQGVLELAGQGPMDAVALWDRKVREMMRPYNWDLC